MEGSVSLSPKKHAQNIKPSLCSPERRQCWLLWSKLNHSSTPTAQFRFHSYCTSTKSSAFAANSNHHSNSTGLLISDPHIQVFKVGLEGSLRQVTHPDRPAGHEAMFLPVSQALSLCDMLQDGYFKEDATPKLEVKQSNGKRCHGRELWPRGDDGAIKDTDAHGNDDTCRWSG